MFFVWFFFHLDIFLQDWLHDSMSIFSVNRQKNEFSTLKNQKAPELLYAGIAYFPNPRRDKYHWPDALSLLSSERNEVGHASVKHQQIKVLVLLNKINMEVFCLREAIAGTKSLVRAHKFHVLGFCSEMQARSDRRSRSDADSRKQKTGIKSALGWLARSLVPLN